MRLWRACCGLRRCFKNQAFGCSRFGSVLMNRRKKFDIIDLVSPLFAVMLFTINVLYNSLFGWWLDSRIQRGRNRRFLDDIEASLGSRLVSEGKVVDQDRPRIMPFDGAAVKVIYNNRSEER